MVNKDVYIQLRFSRDMQRRLVTTSRISECLVSCYLLLRLLDTTVVSELILFCPISVTLLSFPDRPLNSVYIICGLLLSLSRRHQFTRVYCGV